MFQIKYVKKNFYQRKKKKKKKNCYFLPISISIMHDEKHIAQKIFQVYPAEVVPIFIRNNAV